MSIPDSPAGPLCTVTRTAVSSSSKSVSLCFVSSFVSFLFRFHMWGESCYFSFSFFLHSGWGCLAPLHPFNVLPSVLQGAAGTCWAGTEVPGAYPPHDSVMYDLAKWHVIASIRELCPVTQSCPALCDPTDTSDHGIIPGKHTGVGCHFLLHRDLWSPTKTLNLYISRICSTFRETNENQLIVLKGSVEKSLERIHYKVYILWSS